MKQGWEIRKLGEVCDVAAGQGAPQGDANYCSNGTPFIKAGNLEALINGVSESEIQNVSEEVAKQHRLKLYKAGSVVFAKSGMSCMKGYVYSLKTDCYVVSHLAILTPYGISTSFLQYTLTFHRPNKLVKDSAYPSISLEDIKSYKIPVPPLAEQERIVAELDCLSGIIERKKQQLKELDCLAQSIFYEMFGDPITNEKGWEVKKWEDVLSIVNGRNQKTVENPNGEYPIYGSGGVMGYADKYLCPRNTVIIGRKGNINKPIFVKEPFWNVDTAFGLISDKINVDSNFLYFFCRIFNFEQLNKAVTIPSLTKSDLLKINMVCPPLPLQQAFASKIETIEKQKELIKQSIKEVETLFNSRMDYYFN